MNETHKSYLCQIMQQNSKKRFLLLTIPAAQERREEREKREGPSLQIMQQNVHYRENIYYLLRQHDVWCYEEAALNEKATEFRNEKATKFLNKEANKSYLISEHRGCPERRDCFE